jgi:hypothetical protein
LTGGAGIISREAVQRRNAISYGEYKGRPRASTTQAPAVFPEAGPRPGGCDESTDQEGCYHFQCEDATVKSGTLDYEFDRMDAIGDELAPNAIVPFNESSASMNEREGSRSHDRSRGRCSSGASRYSS